MHGSAGPGVTEAPTTITVAVAVTVTTTKDPGESEGVDEGEGVGGSAERDAVRLWEDEAVWVCVTVTVCVQEAGQEGGCKQALLATGHPRGSDWWTTLRKLQAVLLHLTCVTYTTRSDAKCDAEAVALIVTVYTGVGRPRV